MNIKAFALAGLAAVALTGGASAADLIIDDEMMEMAAPDSGSYDWDGFYAGVAAGIWSGNSEYFYVGGLLGVNFVKDMLLFGVEGSIELYDDGDVGGDVIGRVGAALDNVVLSAHGGVGIRDGDPYGIIGVGAEFGLTESVSIAGTVEYIAGDGYDAMRGEASLRFHF
jgi:outer membrane immunogenic protein